LGGAAERRARKWRRSVLLSVIKNGGASTLAVVDGVRKVLKIAREAAPPGLGINELFDQSLLVTASIASVVREGAIAAGLTGLMILFFLGSWRSTLIVSISIPLSILTPIVVLYFLGDTLNTMTLGGMARAVGILVDDSTVTIENTHRLRGEGMSLAAAPRASLSQYWSRRSRSVACSPRWCF
jgi:multidrug efflux pump subunit AcrB